MQFDYSGEPGKYSYAQNEYGKSASGIVSVGATSERNPAAQRNAGGADRQAGDHGGHLIAHSLGGENTERNLDAQAANVNQRGMRSVERDVTNLAKDGQHTVYYSVQNYNSNGSQRPDATMITAASRDNATGKEDVVYQSMQNASYAEQEEWNRIADSVEPAYSDPTLSQEENDLAHEYADVTDLDVPLGDATHFSYDNPSNASLDEGAQDNGAESMDGGDGMDSGMDGDDSMDGGMDGGDSMDGGMDGDDGMDGGME